MSKDIQCTINGVPYRCCVEPSARLLDLLRRDAGVLSRLGRCDTKGTSPKTTGAPAMPTGTTAATTPATQGTTVSERVETSQDSIENPRFFAVKEGCGEGECGACSIFLNGKLVNSCLIPAMRGDGAVIETPEGVRETAIGQAVIQGFVEEGAVQCGFCFPGMLMASVALLRECVPVKRIPTEEEIRKALSGNLCRCTGYDMIIRGVRYAAEALLSGACADVQVATPIAATTPTLTVEPQRASETQLASETPALCDCLEPTALERLCSCGDIKWYTPESVDQAVDLLAKGAVEIISGGTDLMVQRRVHRGVPATLGPIVMALHKIEQLRSYQITQDSIEVGAAMTLSEIAAIAELPELLRTAILEIAAPATRNMGTIGGNICNASPAADTVPPLATLGAEVKLRSKRGERILGVTEFITGLRKIDLEPDELVQSVIIPRRVGSRGVFRKVGTRKANALTKISFAGVVSFSYGEAQGTEKNIDSGRMITYCSLALGSVAPKVVYLPSDRNPLVGKTLAEVATQKSLQNQLVTAVMDQVTPINDQRSTAAYRKRVAQNLIEDFITNYLTV